MEADFDVGTAVKDPSTFCGLSQRADKARQPFRQVRDVASVGNALHDCAADNDRVRDRGDLPHVRGCRDPKADGDW